MLHTLILIWSSSYYIFSQHPDISGVLTVMVLFGLVSVIICAYRAFLKYVCQMPLQFDELIIDGLTFVTIGVLFIIVIALSLLYNQGPMLYQVLTGAQGGFTLPDVPHSVICEINSKGIIYPCKIKTITGCNLISAHLPDGMVFNGNSLSGTILNTTSFTPSLVYKCAHAGTVTVPVQVDLLPLVAKQHFLRRLLSLSSLAECHENRHLVNEDEKLETLRIRIIIIAFTLVLLAEFARFPVRKVIAKQS